MTWSRIFPEMYTNIGLARIPAIGVILCSSEAWLFDDEILYRVGVLSVSFPTPFSQSDLSILGFHVEDPTPGQGVNTMPDKLITSLTDREALYA